jgi:hypothetical protein
LQEPQPLPARVAFMTPGALRTPPATQAAMVDLVTPLQLHTCISAGIWSMVIFWLGAPRSNNSDSRSAGSGVSRSKHCMR